MSKKQYFCIIDTETTVTDKVYDFAAIVADRQGNIVNQCAVIVAEQINDELFYDPSGKAALWTRRYAAEKKQGYQSMLDNGSRMLASANAVNRWIEKAVGKYNPTLTAYNVAFDSSKCKNSGILLDSFSSRFCLWHLACAHFADSKDYKNFVMQNHHFTNRTELGNMAYKTNAECMHHFLTGEFAAEPHTALEDARDFELPILLSIIKRKKWREKIGQAYNWRSYQLKNHFQAK